MKITFLTAALNLKGGSRVIAIYANLLADRGHQVTVISPREKKASFKEKIKSAIKWKGYTFRTGFNTTFFDKRNYDLIILDEHRQIENEDVPDGDIVIATFWITAEWMSLLSDDKGKKVYFIQHYEVHPWLPIERVKATLRLPFHQIVVSQWIADVLTSEYEKESVDVVANGVDLEQFSALERDKNNQFTVGLMYADKMSFKGCDTSIMALEQARRTVDNINLIAFSMAPPTDSLPLPKQTEFHLRPEQERIKDIYSQCDVWLFGSRSEGFGLPLLEAMACRTPIIATKAGAAPELVGEAGGELIDVDDVDAMAKAIIKFGLMSNEEWSALSDSAFEVASSHSWALKVIEFEAALERARDK